MGGDWIKMRTSLPRNPKVVRISVTLKAHASAVCGACFMLWALADEHSEDGSLPGYTYETIDAMVGLPGFCEAASGDVGWVSRNAQGVVLPRFGEHNGSTAKRRANGAKRASRMRENPSRSRNAQGARKAHLEKRRIDDDDEGGLSREDRQKRADYLLVKPEWAKSWMTRRVAEELARLPITEDDVKRVYAEARKCRETLKNPAGYVIAELKRAGGAK